jgi:hypothetical protein
LADRRHRRRARQPPHKVMSVIPVERISEFIDEPAGGVLEVEPL